MASGDVGEEGEERVGDLNGRDLGRSEPLSALGGEALRPLRLVLRRRGRLVSSRSLMVRM